MFSDLVYTSQARLAAIISFASNASPYSYHINQLYTPGKIFCHGQILLMNKGYDGIFFLQDDERF